MKLALLTHHSRLPATMWVPDDVSVGDVFNWNGERWGVSSIYSNHFPHSGLEVRKRERPRPNESPASVG